MLMLVGISTLVGQAVDETESLAPLRLVQSPYVVNPFPALPLPIGLLGDTLIQPLGLFDIPFQKTKTLVQVAEDWSTITITEISDGQLYRIPFTAELDWYFKAMLQRNRQVKFIETMQGGADRQDQQLVKPRKGKAIEVVGVDVGDFGRVSLRVRGNVNISGKMVFQDQQLIHSNINQAQNTHIEFDQKQNLNIEGKIGDRITVLMDQDSERDFDWENNIRISYEGNEDEILQRVEAGNISLSLPATQYVTFSGKNKGLFGLKAISKLGPVDITTIASIEQTRKEKQKFEGSNEATTQQIFDYNYMKNRYFFIHEWYRNGVDTTFTDFKTLHINPFYPLTEDGRHLQNNVVVRDFELYKSVLGSTPGSVPGVAYVNPDNIGSNPDDSVSITFVRMERDEEYYINEDLGYIRLNTVISDAVLGAVFNIVAGEDTIRSIGKVDSTELQLQLIRRRSPIRNEPVWDLMFKNIYFLGTANVNPDGFAVRIVNDLLSPPSERSADGISYLTSFGLDLQNENGDLAPDELIDITNSNLVNLLYGELIFPTYLPFVNADSIAGGTSSDALLGQLGSGLMYTSTTDNLIRGDSHFKIESDYSNKASNISLGFMVVEGSEEVKLNGLTLQRGIDYQIDYFGGSLTFLNEDALAPNANLEVLYEKHELVSFDKKTIVGTRAQMDLGQNSFLGATALYYNQSVLNEKIEVGYEPTRNFIWDINGRYQSNLEGFTRFLDRLPVIETEKMTTFSVEGEFAQVLPNPNPINNPATGDNRGVAYIDDFEGAKRITGPQILQRFWKPSSAPLDLLTGETLGQANRAKLFWFNPYVPVSTKNIWPNQSTSTRAQNETTNILWLDFSRYEHQSDTLNNSVWAGIISPFYSGDYDQTDSKFFEIWLRGTVGRLTVDLGRISEDWNGNGVLDTEDRPEAGFTLGNGFLEDDEDVGLDGCQDEFEDGWGGCLDSLTYMEYYNNGDTIHINHRVADTEDPNGDNWAQYVGGKIGRTNGPDKVNGTEGNRRQEGGIYPDTEDIDGSGFLDSVNDYFTKTFKLSKTAGDSDYVAGETVKDGTLTGWRLYRIPLSHFTRAKVDGSIDWNDIRNMRLTITEVESQATLQIAKIELVGNEWIELGVSSDTTGFVKDDSVFAITIINTEDNPDYDPPKGVKGEYDRINQIRSKEQSLVLKFSNLEPGYQGAAEKTLLELGGKRAQSYLTYDRMKMFIYGKNLEGTTEDVFGDDWSDAEFFMRFGRGDSYYEITQPVYVGWDEEDGRNSLDLDLEWLTALKLASATNVKKVRSTDTLLVWDDTKAYIFTDENGDSTGKRIQIKGTPALSRIQYMRVGVRNRSDNPIWGEVWLDELRLSGVKKDRGVAMRVQAKLNLADLGNVAVAYSRRDADFHVLQERLGSNSNSEDLRVNASLNLNKFLPQSWGLKIPISTAFSNSIKQPKYHPQNEDILLTGNNLADSILTINNSVNFSTSVSKTTKSDRWPVKYTLDRIKTSFSTKRSTSSSFQVEQNRTENYSGKISYSLPFGRDNYISPLKWLGNLPLVGSKMEEFHLYYTPASLNANMNFKESLSQKTPRVGKKTESYNLGLTRAYGLDYKVTESLKSVKYNRSIASDMDEYRAIAWMAIRDLDPGIVTNSTESISSAYSPDILAWLKPNFSYSAQYRWNKPITSTIDGANIATSLSFSSSMNLNITNLVEFLYKPPSRKVVGRSRGKQVKEPDPAEGDQKEKDRPILKGIHTLSKNINPINIRYNSRLTRSGNGIQGTVPTGYKFGWLPDHGLPHTPEVGSNIGDWNHNQDISFNSGLKLTKLISTTLKYSQNVTSKIAGSGSETRSLKRDMLPYGEQLDDKFPFPNWTLRWSGLQKLPILKKFARSVSLEHSFRGSETRNWRMETAVSDPMPLFNVGSFIDDYGDFERNSKIDASFAPLLSVSMQLNKGISTTTRLNYTKSLDQQEGGQTFKVEKSLNSSATYNHKGGLKIPLPFLKNVEIQNNINFTLNFDYNDNSTKTRNNVNVDFTKPNKISSWKTGLRISYSFSSRVSGGLIYEYRESDHFSTGKKIDRDFGFDVKIAIQG